MVNKKLISLMLFGLLVGILAKNVGVHQESSGITGFLKDKIGNVYNYLTGKSTVNQVDEPYLERDVIEETYERIEVIGEPGKIKQTHIKETQAPPEIPTRTILGEEFAGMGFAKREFEYLKNLALDVYHSIIGTTPTKTLKGTIEQGKEKIHQAQDYYEPSLHYAKETLKEANKKVKEGKEYAEQKVEEGKKTVKEGAEYLGEKAKQAKDYVTEKTQEGKETTQQAKENLEAKYQQGKEYLEEKIEQGKEFLSPKIENAKETVSGAGRTIKEAASGAKEVLEQKFEEGKDYVKEKWEEGKEYVKLRSEEALKRAQAREFEEKSREAEGILKEGATIICDTAEKTACYLEEKVEDAKELLKEGKEYAQEKLEEGKELLKEGKEKAATTTENLKGKVEGAKETIVKDATKAKEYLEEKVGSAAESAKKTFEEGAERVKDVLKNGYKQGKEFITEKLEMPQRNIRDLTESWKSFIQEIPVASEKAKKRLIEEKEKILSSLKKSPVYPQEKLRGEIVAVEKLYSDKIKGLQTSFQSLKPFEGGEAFNYKGVLHCGRCGREYTLNNFFEKFLKVKSQPIPESVSPSQRQNLLVFYRGWATWANEMNIKDECGHTEWTADVYFVEK